MVSIRGTNYTLFVDQRAHSAVRCGTTRPSAASPDVYENANFVFLGDDTTSASAEVELLGVALVRPTTVQIDRDGAVSWTGVPGQTYTVETSGDLVSWSVAGPVTSATAGTRHLVVPGPAPACFRVVHP